MELFSARPTTRRSKILSHHCIVSSIRWIHPPRILVTKRIECGISIVETPTSSLDTIDKEVWTPMQIEFPFALKLLSLRKSLMFNTGKRKLKLVSTHFCRVRHCPICQWRRSLQWKARAYENLPRVVADYPNGRWMFLTLTMKNCPLEDLRETSDSS
jgi:hypothetical protein